MPPDRLAEKQRVSEPGQPIPPEVVTSRGGERWGWKHCASFLAIGLPLTAFSTLSSTHGVGEITKLSLEALQSVNVISPLSDFQINHLSSLMSPVGTAAGFIGGFVLTKMITAIPRLLRS